MKFRLSFTPLPYRRRSLCRVRARLAAVHEARAIGQMWTVGEILRLWGRGMQAIPPPPCIYRRKGARA